MLRSLVTRGVWRSLDPAQTRICRSLSSQAQQRDEPLRILFCGSEAFSIASLEALHEYQKSAENNILSIDVATRKDKAGGRGMKELRSPPIKRTAARLGLRVHQFDTFTGWQLPEYGNTAHPYINLVVAVSFGLLVPPRILKSAKFGGINVHPSMLPDLRGAAPINWSIIDGYSHTGVSVQTLHPSKFDHGVILSQTPKPGLAIPDPETITAHDLRLLLAPVGAEMLVDAIHRKLYLQPHAESTSNFQSSTELPINSAPKIVPSMKQIDPMHDSVEMILRKNRAIPKLWAEIPYLTEKGEQTKRIIFGPGMRAATKEDFPEEAVYSIIQEIPIGLPFALLPPTEDVHQSEKSVYLKVRDNEIVVISTLLVAGDRERPAAAAAAHAKLLGEPSTEGALKLYRFKHCLNGLNTTV